ncbi:MAG TPA: FtsH protease activity modulator HflK, partial [Hyphomicrobiaceae bacterium]|nr:FtsH protease activity modulator HflK [Hyphomicrobiaceae bacterium]
GQGPSGGGGGGGQQPDLEELLKRSQDRIKQTIGGGGLPGPLLLLIAAPLIALVCFYAFTFRVNPDEVGVVMRFGRFDRQEPPGLHFRWPPPVEEVYKPRVTRQNIIEIGLRSGTGGRGYQGSRDAPESHMLTGDENIVDLEFVVYWRIKDASQYLFNIQNPESTVREVAESAMREIVGQSNIAPLLTEARQKTESEVQRLMQTTLDSYVAGIRVDQVTLQRVDPPAQVIDAFRDVQAARADKERLQNEANTYANKVVPEARGDADRILQAAEGYKQQTVAEASGQAARFLKIYEEFAKAPEVTRKRMFLETMERILGGSEKIIIDPRSTPQGVTPFLPLDQLNRQSRPQGTN